MTQNAESVRLGYRLAARLNDAYHDGRNDSETVWRIVEALADFFVVETEPDGIKRDRFLSLAAQS